MEGDAMKPLTSNVSERMQSEMTYYLQVSSIAASSHPVVFYFCSVFEQTYWNSLKAENNLRV
jgi:hypothetical protein